MKQLTRVAESIRSLQRFQDSLSQSCTRCEDTDLITRILTHNGKVGANLWYYRTIDPTLAFYTRTNCLIVRGTSRTIRKQT